MLHDIDVRLYEWGDYVREQQDFGLGFPKRNVIHKAMQEGPNAARSGGGGEAVMPKSVEQIEDTLCNSHESIKVTAKLRYVNQNTDKVAAQKLSISVSQYRQRIDQLHYYIAGSLGLSLS